MLDRIGRAKTGEIGGEGSPTLRTSDLEPRLLSNSKGHRGVHRGLPGGGGNVEDGGRGAVEGHGAEEEDGVGELLQNADEPPRRLVQDRGARMEESEGRGGESRVQPPGSARVHPWGRVVSSERKERTRKRIGRGVVRLRQVLLRFHGQVELPRRDAEQREGKVGRGGRGALPRPLRPPGPPRPPPERGDRRPLERVAPFPSPSVEPRLDDEHRRRGGGSLQSFVGGDEGR